MRIVSVVFAICLTTTACEQRSNRDAPSPRPGESAATGSEKGASAPGDPTSSTDPTAESAPAESIAAASNVLPVVQEVTLPAGTALPLRLETTVASDASSVEDTVRATLRQPLVLDDKQVLPVGTDVSGVVTAARRSAKVKGRALVAFRFTRLTVDEESYPIRTRVISRQAPGTKAKDAKTIGIPAAGGAVVGGIIGGKKGAAIGGAAAGGAGTAVVLSTRGKEVRLPAGTNITARLSEPLTVRVPLKPDAAR
jgi:hypothetical protein